VNSYDIQEGVMMKTMYYVLAMLMLSAVGFAAVNPQLEIYNYTLSHSPAAPGDTLTLTVHLKNIAFGACADTISVQAMTSYPLSVSGLDTQYRDSLCLGDPDSAGTVSFVLPVDSLAQSGTYPVTVITNYQKNFDKFSSSNTINVVVLGTPSVSASVTSSNPVDIYPGDTGSLTVTFQNNGTGKVESGHVAFTAPPGLEVKWAGADQDIGGIPAHGSASVTFSIEALKSTSSGDYPITGVLQYSGDNTPSATQEFTFIMPVKEKAEFVASAATGTALNPASDSEVQVTLTNTGTQEARKVRVRIRPIYPFSTDGTVRYVESLAPGQSANLTYLIHVDKDATAGQQVSGVILDFEDPQGNSFTDTEYFAMSVKTKTLMDDIVGYWYIFAIIALVVLYVILKRVIGLIRGMLGGAKKSR
jgi:hypothetical protein